MSVNLGYGHIICGCHVTWLYIRVTGKWVSGHKRDMGEGILSLMLVFHGILGNSLAPIFLLSLETGHNDTKTTEPSNKVPHTSWVLSVTQHTAPSHDSFTKEARDRPWPAVCLTGPWERNTESPKNPRGKLGVWERVVSKETNNTWLNVSDF